jgi:hypothetical protein
MKFMRHLTLIQTLVCTASLLALAACSNSLLPAAALPTETIPASMPVLPTDISSPAPLPSTVPSAVVPNSGGEPTATLPDSTSVPDQGTNITLKDQGQTIQLKVGQRFLLYLGTDTYDWSVDIENQSVVSRVMGVMVIRGAQGLFEARSPGTTTLTATGDPLCRQSQPACAMPSILFHVTLVVE